MTTRCVHNGRAISDLGAVAKATLIERAEAVGFKFAGRDGGYKWVFPVVIPHAGSLILAGPDSTPVRGVATIPCPRTFASVADAAWAALDAIGLIGSDGRIIKVN